MAILQRYKNAISISIFASLAKALFFVTLHVFLLTNLHLMKKSDNPETKSTSAQFREGHLGIPKPYLPPLKPTDGKRNMNIKVFDDNYITIIRDTGAVYLPEEIRITPTIIEPEQDADKYRENVIWKLRKDPKVLFAFENYKGMCEEDAKLPDGFRIRVQIVEHSSEEDMFDEEGPNARFVVFFYDCEVYRKEYNERIEREHRSSWAEDELGASYYNILDSLSWDLSNVLDRLRSYDYSFVDYEKRKMIPVKAPDNMGYSEVVSHLCSLEHVRLKPIPVRSGISTPYLIDNMHNYILLWETPVKKSIYIEAKVFSPGYVNNDDDAELIQCSDGSQSVRYYIGCPYMYRDSLSNTFSYYLDKLASINHYLDGNIDEPLNRPEWQEAYFIHEVFEMDNKLIEFENQ